ncbi:hypothetical protein B7486_67735, partial [cyanobacterium TDX16]
APELGHEGRNGDEGLLFLAVCADLRRQFEFMQAEWLQDGNRFGLGEERDPLLGNRDHVDRGRRDHDSRTVDEEQATAAGDAGRVSVGIDGRRHRRTLGSFVTMRGGEYFLLPSRSALELLGDRRAD